MSLQFECLPFSELSLVQLYELLRLRQEVFVVEQFCPYLDADGKDQAAYHLLAYTENRQLVAYTRLLPPGEVYPNYVAIGRVVASSTIRGQQLGYRLMEATMAAAKRRFPGYGCKLSAQSHLQTFYVRLGFRVAGPGYLEDGIPHLPMVRKLEH